MKIMAFDEFADKILGIKLLPFHKYLYESLNKSGGKLIVCHPTRKMGIASFRRWVAEYEKYKSKETK